MPTRSPSLALVAGLAVALFVTDAHARRLTSPLAPLSPDVLATHAGSGDSADDSRALVQWLGTGAVSLVAVPLALVAASALGNLSNNLIVAAVPSLLTFLVLPSLASAAAASLLGSMDGTHTSFLAPLAGGAIIQLLAFGGAFLAGVTTSSIGASAIFAIIDAVALTAMTVFLANTCVGPYEGGASLLPPPADPRQTKPFEAPVAASSPAPVQVVPVAFRF